MYHPSSENLKPIQVVGLMPKFETLPIERKIMGYKKHARARGAKPGSTGLVRTRCSRTLNKEHVRVKLHPEDPDNCQRCATLTL